MSRSTVSKWMSGDSEPTKARRNEIAEAFDLPEDYFEEIVIPKKKIETLTPKEAAYLMGMSVGSVQKGLIQGIFPWGYAIRTSEKKHRYFINAKKFFATENNIVPISKDTTWVAFLAGRDNKEIVE